MPTSASRRLETAHEALKQYEIKPTLITFLQHSENVTFRVDCLDDVFLLRLHSPRAESFGKDGADSQVVNSELLWLAELSKRGLPVPKPVLNNAGGYVSQVGGINATLLTWQEGSLLTRETESEETAGQVGNLVGRLHVHAGEWQFPAGFSRPQRDSAYFQNALISLEPAIQDGRISYPDYKSLEISLEILREETSRLARANQTWGLLHGDLHRGNFLFHDGQVRVIDFSMCAFGDFAYDLATCLSNVRTIFHPIFLKQYTQFIPLPPGYERLLEGYFLASYIATFALWVSDFKSQETFVQRVSYISREYAARFNRDERFWFR